MTKPQDLKPSDFQEVLASLPDDDFIPRAIVGDWATRNFNEIHAALTRCAAEPVDAGELGKFEHMSDKSNEPWTRYSVPGGWIYTYHRLECGQMNSVFVPAPDRASLSPVTCDACEDAESCGSGLGCLCSKKPPIQATQAKGE
jgi:hypothetical protein